MMKRIQQWILAYKWPLIAAASWLAIATAVFGYLFWEELWKKLKNAEWWADNTLTFLIFTVLVGWIVYLTEREHERRRRAPFENWKVSITPRKGEPYEHDLFWEEVQKYLSSRVEERRFIQSVCSSEDIRIKQGKINIDDESNWIFRDQKNRLYIFNFRKLEE